MRQHDDERTSGDLLAAAVALYGVPAEEFVAARSAAVRAARSAGDRELARTLGALRRPSGGAAASNLLVRAQPDDLARLLDLGVRLREAQAALAGADLRALHSEQQRTMTDVLDGALALVADRGGAAGPAVRARLEGTLRAAMGDPDAAAAVATGMLTRDLTSSGFEPVDVTDAVAVPGAPALAGAPTRRTPLRAVATRDDPPEDGDEGDGGQDAARHQIGGRRPRGRLRTEEPPPGPARVVGAPAPGTSAPGAARPAAGRSAERPPSGGRRASSGAGADESATGASRRPGAGGGRTPDAAAPGPDARAERARAAEAERDRRRAAARRAAEDDVAAARSEADERAGARAAAEERVASAGRRADELADLVARTQDEIARLRDALLAAQQEAREVGVEARRARSARGTAVTAADRAAERLRAAERALDDL